MKSLKPRTFPFKCLYQKSRTESHLVIGLFLLNASVSVVVNQVASKHYSLIVVIYCHRPCCAAFLTVYLGSLSEAFLDALWKRASVDFQEECCRESRLCYKGLAPLLECVVLIRKRKDGMKSCPTLAIPWTVACQAPLSMGFSRQEYWRGRTYRWLLKLPFNVEL